MMTIKELKEKIKDLPDDMLIGNTGHFGEYLECTEVNVHTAHFKQEGNKLVGWYFDFGIPLIKKEIFCICIEDKGEEPD